MKIIDIDTLIMQQLCGAASAANDAIDNATESMNRVAVHYDWGCKEKDAINNYTITNRQKVTQLQDHSRCFLNTVRQAATEFEDSEKSILDMIGHADQVIADAISIPLGNDSQGNVVSVPIFPDFNPADILQSIFDASDFRFPQHILESYEFKAISDPIRVVAMDDPIKVLS